ncbi:outer membrane lipoprotein-sorting protein [Colwellia sp. BRX8-4]|uniref:outer membrane lipoprotein-sorting protein n=1 Tax=Colwellia sp. BRX8-4 TaxID=2759836 RepID=UPI0015F4B027|nr:outer membrane lipoprotein-sorting protein [Colwellia sp. BRX8-4]MBA6362652.1 outer membrane lipoprotein-sorting protein [Colwellia sp. BRX8-8]MBA6372846.1 outer membrane lipoprotein-sorting protein [Colwellia sp. BRX8-4]
MKYLSKLLILVCSLSSFVGQAGDLTNANEIITKANLASYYSADDGSAQARMIIVDAQGNKQMRQFTILRKDQTDLGNQDILVFFSRPTDVQGTVFRVVKKVTSDDDRWLYLPALDLVKRISAGDKRTSFVGAHFFYEDVSGRNPAEDNFTLLKTDNNFYTIKAQPKDLNSVEFDHYIVSVDKNTFLPMQVDFYDSQGKKSRSLQVLKTEAIDGFTTVMHSKITQHSDGSYTEMQFRNVKYNVGLPNDIFSERSLRNPPKEWLD